MIDNNPKAAAAERDGKDPLDYLEPAANRPIARVLKLGGAKYGRRNYAAPGQRMLLSTYVGAILRHIAELQEGTAFDTETGEHQLAHVGACVHVVMAALEASTITNDLRNTAVTMRSDAVHIDGNQGAKAGLYDVPAAYAALKLPAAYASPYAPYSDLPAAKAGSFGTRGHLPAVPVAAAQAEAPRCRGCITPRSCAFAGCYKAVDGEPIKHDSGSDN